MFHEDGSMPPDNMIFVFGSNLAGRHGAGAAKYAMMLGAKYGQGSGLSGKTYAIPTKDYSIRTLSLKAIAVYVQDFLRFAKSQPQQLFFVTRIGCGLAGYTDDHIAPMFRRAPENCSFATSWLNILTEPEL